MTHETQLTTTEAQIAPVAQASFNVATLCEAIVARGVTPESVSVMEKLIALQERQEERQAERDFARAFAALQAAMPDVQATKAVPGNNGTIKYHFAPYEEIMDKLRPLLQAHGFTVSFSMAYSEGRITQTCTLQHIGGHKRSNDFAVRIGSGPPGCSEAQGDGAAATYAKRHAFCNALNIVVDRDSDGRRPEDKAETVGSPLRPEQIQTLRELIDDCQRAGGPGLDLAGFLKFANAASVEGIGSADYPRCFAALQKKLGRA